MIPPLQEKALVCRTNRPGPFLWRLGWRSFLWGQRQSRGATVNVAVGARASGVLCERVASQSPNLASACFVDSGQSRPSAATSSQRRFRPKVSICDCGEMFRAKERRLGATGSGPAYRLMLLYFGCRLAVCSVPVSPTLSAPLSRIVALVQITPAM